jgi:probable F420-dependent oxidoreductase
MKFGISTQSRGTLVSGQAYLDVALAAERSGFDFLAVNDHIVVPGGVGSAYPYVAGGQWAGADHGHCFDQLATLAFLAGSTSRLRLLSSVMIVPYRPALATAKMLATIDVLSGGRLILGVGAGWMKEEFELLGAPFAERGRVTDEYLEAFKALWTEEKPAYRGRHVAFSDVIFSPKPLQKPHPPIWVGGESRAALRRAARLGDAWYPGSNSQGKPLDTPARLAAGIGELHRAAGAAGRSPQSVAVCLLVQDPFEWTARTTADGEARRLFTGTSADMLGDAAALAALGVGHVAVRLGGASIAQSLELIDRFGREVIAASGRER